jgi:hypothetical protein
MNDSRKQQAIEELIDTLLLHRFSSEAEIHNVKQVLPVLERELKRKKLDPQARKDLETAHSFLAEQIDVAATNIRITEQNIRHLREKLKE